MSPLDVATLARTDRRDNDGKRLCSLPLCDGKHFARGMCNTHHRQWKRTGNPLVTRTTCTVKGCACGGKVHGDTITEAKTPALTPYLDWLDLVKLEGAQGAVGWVDQARCAGMPSRIFYPDGQGSTGRTAYKPAISVCERCPVRYPCLAAHLNEKWGCYGGTTPADRRRITKILTIRTRDAA